MMKLDEFISETLKQLIDGVTEAQNYASSKGSIIVPEGLVNFSNDSPNYANKYREKPAQVIEFDVALTTVEKNESSGKAGIFISAFKIGIDGKDGFENSSISRIKFSIPIYLPSQKP